jgi:hypothetical protein
LALTHSIGTSLSNKNAIYRPNGGVSWGSSARRAAAVPGRRPLCATVGGVGKISFDILGKKGVFVTFFSYLAVQLKSSKVAAGFAATQQAAGKKHAGGKGEIRIRLFPRAGG